MIQNNQKTSLLVPSQLPEFIRGDEDYSKFVLFLQAYYEWMEQEGNVLDRSNNLLNYSDIDATTEEFLQYFTNEFLQYFPKDALVDQRTAVKIAKELYQQKGTIASYKFLFRVLYNIDFDVFYTKDAVLRASDGEWYIAKSLKLSSFSTDALDFLNLNNYRIFGETTKSLAVIESSILVGDKVEVFISNIERLFQSGELIRIIDNQNQDVLVNGQPLVAKIVGQISQVKIDPDRRGLLYQVGDPVIVYDGLSSNTGLGAIAEVGATTKGSVQRINVVQGGYGYRENPNTVISISNAPGAVASVSTVDPNPLTSANVAFIPTDVISLKRFITIGNTNYNFSNVAISNANTTLANAFSFTSFMTYPISTVQVDNGGAGINKTPVITADSVFTTDIQTNASLGSLGILAPIQIVDPGTGYQVNDTITITGGTGFGAFANVTGVSANGGITNVSFVQSGTSLYPLGGMGYKKTSLPSLAVVSANVQASNAVLSVPGILGDGATFSVVVDRVGSIQSINLLNGGEDYIATPNVSLKVQDIVVSNVSIGNLPLKGDKVYQGLAIDASSYEATVNSVSLLSPNDDPDLSLYEFRVFNYTSNPNPNLPLKINGKDIVYNMANVAFDPSYDENGIKNYGDGNARANASFLNGLVIGEGKYLSSRGQPSSFSILQNEIYNNYTYQITVEKEISKYREVLLNLLHPSGMKMLGRYAMKANSTMELHAFEALYSGYPLSHLTGYAGSSAEMVANFVNKSNNIIQFNNLAGANLSNIIFVGNMLEVTPTNGPYIKSEITFIDHVANTVTLKENTWLTFANVANIQANSGSNVINILSLTGSYDIINNKKYSDPANPIRDIVYVGDTILVANNGPLTVQQVDYQNDRLIVSGTIANNSLSLMSVNRNISTTNVRVFGTVGIPYVPELITQDGYTLTTQDGNIILLG